MQKKNQRILRQWFISSKKKVKRVKDKDEKLIAKRGSVNAHSVKRLENCNSLNSQINIPCIM